MSDYIFTNNEVQSQRIIYTPSSFARTNLLYLQETGSLKALTPHTSARDNLSSFLFFLVTEGTGTVTYNGITYPLAQGDCVFLNCKTSYSHCSSENLWSLSWCHFYGSNLLGIYNKYIERGGAPVFHPDNVQQYQSILKDLYTIASSSSYTRDMQIFNQLSTLVTLIMEQSWNPDNQDGSSKQKRDIQEVKDYIDSHFSEKLTLESLASLFYISKHYLARCFKSQFGTTVVNYIQHVRITNAKHMLRFSDDSVESIGEKCGISDANYFSRMFKKEEGVSPVEYRRSWKGKR